MYLQFLGLLVSISCFIYNTGSIHVQVYETCICINNMRANLFLLSILPLNSTWPNRRAVSAQMSSDKGKFFLGLRDGQSK